MTSYGEVERELAALLRRARAWNREVATVVHPDLQPTAYALLARVDELGSTRAIDLSDYFGIDKGAISRQVGLLERVGLVSREPDPDDGRAQLLVMTTEGRKRLAMARSGRRQVVREQLDRWPEQDVATFAELLGRFNQQMDAAVGGDGDR
jgi:DNA-binding MarR family transcriptional regulator